jgi:outer membrane protein insertion porin family
MLKILLLVFIIINLFVNHARSVIVENINVIGNERISKDTIILFGNIDKNLDFNENRINQILKDLYETGFFENISINISNKKMFIKVEENPIIQTLYIEGVKNKKIKGKIKELTKLKDKSSLNLVDIKSDKILISNFLKNLGYFFTEISVDIVELENRFVNLYYNINLNEKSKISKIKFLGDKVFKAGKLKNLIISEEYRFWKILSSKKYLNKNIIEIDKKLLKNFYKNNGYYNAEIISTFINHENSENFELIYNIKAGQKFYFNDIELKISNEYDTNDFKPLVKVFKKLKGKPYSLNSIQKILSEIDKIFYLERLDFVKATVTENFIDNKINLNFNIEETEKSHVERIDIYGNSVTRENVIRNNLLIDEGDGFNSIKFKRSINNLKSLNFFETVDYTINKGSDDSKKIIEINVVEKPTGEIAAGAGVGTNGGTVGFTVSENNYLGKGIEFTSDLSLSEDSIKGLLYINNPKFKDTDRSINFTVESSDTDKLADFGYKSSKTGFAIGTGVEPYDDLFFNTSISSYIEKLETSSKASSSIKKQKGNYFDTFLGYSFNYDKRNQKFKTTDGYQSYFNQTLPVISEKNTVSSFYNYKKYKSIGKNANIVTLAFYGASSNSISGDDVKLSERLYVPSNKLRGFESGRVGPKDEDEYIGGNYVSTINLATTLPQLLPNSQNLEMSVFFDAANIWGVDYSDTLDDSNKIRSSIGVAFNWFTPIGPLNFSLTETISKATTDKEESFRFNLGTTF